MHTATRPAEKCWLILLWTAWRLSFEGVQYARTIEGIQHARVLVSCISIRLVRTFSLRCLHFFFSSTRCLPFFFLQAQKQLRYAAGFVFTSTATEQLHTQVLSATYPHLATFTPTDSNNRTVPVSSTVVARKPLSFNCRIVSLRCYHIYFCGTSASMPFWVS